MWGKMKQILDILLFFLFLRDISASTCIETFEERERDYYDFYYEDYTSSRELLKESSTLTCTNISSVMNLPLPPYYFDTLVSHKHILNISQSDVSVIPKEAFLKFHTIYKLYLSGIHIKQIVPGAFENLTKLQELYLDNNDLVELEDDVFAPLTELEILDLSNNMISHIKKHVFQSLENLEKLNLKHNSISKIEDGFLELLPRLQTLQLSGNPLNIFPEDAMPDWNNCTVTTLELSDALITKFDVDLSDSMMVFLNFSSNQMQSFNFSRVPQTIGYIDLSRNTIATLNNFDKLIRDPTVYLDYNLIKSLNEVVGTASELHLSHNLIKNLEGSPFNASEILTHIDLSYNDISTIDKDAFLGLKNLEILRLNHNKIKLVEVGAFRDFKRLRELDISHNNIQQLQFGIFEGLSNLEVLDISDNKLSDLNEHVFHPLVELTYLHIDSSQINLMDVNTLSQYLKELRKISISNNNNHTLTCKKLLDVYRKFKLSHSNIEFIRGNIFDVENFYGIPCINQMEAKQPTVEISTFSPEDLFRHFQKAVHKGVRDSKINTFLNDDFKNSTFFRYFNNSSKISGSPSQNHSNALIAANVIQMILSLLFLLIFCLICIMFIKHKRNIISAFAS